MTVANAKVSVSLGKFEVKDSFDPKHKSSMLPVMGAAFKKGIDASGDFTTGPGDDEAKSFMIRVSISITKDDKSKPPKVSVSANAAGLLTGGGTSGQQFAAQSNVTATTGSKIDNDVKLTVQDAIEGLTDKNGKMLQAMRNFLK
jgi:hypothetical protein